MRHRILPTAVLALASVAPAAFAWDQPGFCFASPPDLGVNDMGCLLAQHHVTLGCGGGNYCPDQPVTRAQAAMFLERAWRGTDAWSPAGGWSSGGSSPAYATVTVYVAAVPADPAAAGARLLAVQTGILDNGPGQHYVLKLEPGIYDVGSDALFLKPYVDLEGAGAAATWIVGTPALGQAVVRQQHHSEIRRIGIRATGGAGSAVSESDSGGIEIRALREVTLQSDRSGLSCSGVELFVSQTAIEVSGIGTSAQAIASTDCQIDVSASSLSAMGGQQATAVIAHGGIAIRHSRIAAGGASVNNYGILLQDGFLTLEDSEVVVADQNSSDLNLNRANAAIRRSELVAPAAASHSVLTTGDSDSFVVDLTATRILHGDVFVDSAYKVRFAESMLADVTADVALGGLLRCYKTYDGGFTNSNGISQCP